MENSLHRRIHIGSHSPVIFYLQINYKYFIEIWGKPRIAQSPNIILTIFLLQLYRTYEYLELLFSNNQVFLLS